MRHYCRDNIVREIRDRLPSSHKEEPGADPDKDDDDDDNMCFTLDKNGQIVLRRIDKVDEGNEDDATKASSSSDTQSSAKIDLTLSEAYERLPEQYQRAFSKQHPDLEFLINFSQKLMVPGTTLKSLFPKSTQRTYVHYILNMEYDNSTRKKYICQFCVQHSSCSVEWRRHQEAYHKVAKGS